MRRVVSVLLSLVAATAAAEVRVEVVLDSSRDMWAPLTDGRPGFVGARMALEAWILERAADSDLVIGLRIAGGRVPVIDDGGCDGPEPLISLGPVEATAWHAALESLHPTGYRPLLLAVATAANDLGVGPDRRRVVVVTSGEETCFGDARAAIEALAAGVELRIVGVGLADPVVGRFAAVAPTRNATSTASLLAALRWAVEELPSVAPAAAPVRVRVDGLWGHAAASLVDAITAERHDLPLVGGQFVGAAPPGCYTLELTGGGAESTTRLEGLHVTAGTGLGAELELLPPPLPDFDVIPSRPWSGGPIFVWFGAVGPGKFRISLSPMDAPMSAWLDLGTSAGPEGMVELRATDDPGQLEVRLYEELGGGIDRLVTRAPIEIVAPESAVEAPAEIRPFEPIPVTWSGPDNPGDFLSLVPADRPSTNPAACRPTSSGNPALLAAPGEEGRWEVHYVSGLSGLTFARTAVAVTSVIVTLDVPVEVAAGESFEVVWEGPADDADFLSVAAEGGADDEYLSLFLASHGNPARFVAPREAGSYEVRYVDGDDGRILRRASVAVVETPVRLKAPRKIRAGTRFDVQWTGPDLPGDLLAVARPGASPQDYEDWAYTSLGSPTSLAAPFETGSYELRYITDRGREVVAAITIRIE